MNNISRMILAILIYFVALASLILFFVNDFKFYYLIVSIIGFTVAHYVHPKKIKGATNNSIELLDILSSMIEITFEILILPFRLIAWIFKAINIFD